MLYANFSNFYYSNYCIVLESCILLFVTVIFDSNYQECVFIVNYFFFCHFFKYSTYLINVLILKFCTPNFPQKYKFVRKKNLHTSAATAKCTCSSLCANIYNTLYTLGLSSTTYPKKRVFVTIRNVMQFTTFFPLYSLPSPSTLTTYCQCSENPFNLSPVAKLTN